MSYFMLNPHFQLVWKVSTGPSRMEPSGGKFRLQPDGTMTSASPPARC